MFMKRFVFPVAVAFCLLVVLSQPTTVAAKDNWVSVRTKNFFLIGNGSEKDIRQVALKLEQFREAFTILFPKIRFNTPVPTTVVVFKSQSSYGPFKPNPNLAGYFQPGPDVNYITLTTEGGSQDDPFTVIFHEYTHLLVNNTFKNAPLWFNEGLAEYYSTFKMEDSQKFALGTAIGNHVYLLRESKILPLKTLFEVDHKSPHYNESKKQGIFYAQSWAFLHYMLIGKTGKAERFTKFLDLTASNIPSEEAFQQAFGMPYDAMEKELRNYVKQDRYNVLNGHFTNKLDIDTTAQATPLTEAEAQAYLGDLLLHSYRKDAYVYLEKALKLDPNLGMAHASLGMAYFREGRVAEARASLERAVTLNSQNYLAHYYYAYTLSRLSPNGPSVTYTPELSAKIRDHLQKAIALRPDFAESYNLLAFVSLVTGENLEGAVASLKKVLNDSPGRYDFAFTLAQLYARTGDYKQARQMLEQIAKSSAEDQIRGAAESMLKQISASEENKARYEEAMKAAAANSGGTRTVVTISSDSSGAPIDPGATTASTSSPPSMATRSGSGVGPGSTRTPSSTSTPSSTGMPPSIPAPTPAADPSAYLREVLRPAADGETQLQATLLRIECDAKGIVFVVQTAGGLLRLRTATFDDIEITTYDTSVKGEITCGERKPANTVVVDYIPNTDKRIKADGIIKSIEFVPSDFKLKP
jgi:tetratricopeptide (TPR) repeat protein